MATTILRALTVPEIRKKLAFTALLLALYRLGSHIPVPGIDVKAVDQDPEPVRQRRDPEPAEHVQRRRALPDRAVRARDHAVHHGVDHPAAPDGRRAVAGEAAKEGEVGQQRITQYTRYLTVGLAFAQSIGYVFLFQQLRAEHRRSRSSRLRHAARVPDRDLAHRGLVLLMWMGELITQRGIGNGISLMIFASIVVALPQRRAGVVDEPRPGLQGQDAVPRARRHRRGGLHPGGPAPDPGPVRQARHRAAHERRAGRPTCRCA